MAAIRSARATGGESEEMCELRSEINIGIDSSADHRIQGYCLHHSLSAMHCTPHLAPPFSLVLPTYLVRSVASGWNTCEGTPVPQPGASSKMLSKPSAHSKFCSQEEGGEERDGGAVQSRVWIAAGEV